MKYYIIAGEASGDAHGAKLIRHIKQLDQDATFRFWGGDRMHQEYDGLARHIRKTSFMGFLEVLKNIGNVLKLFSFAQKDIIEYKPDVVVLIDYPGFNMRMAKWLHQKGIMVIYYIPPQVWAWNEKRVENLKRYCSKVISILPFEVSFLKSKGVDAIYVGHPLLEDISASVINDNSQKSKKNIAILPGSRKQEVSSMLGPMMEGAIRTRPNKIIISKIKHIGEEFYTSQIPGKSDIEIVISEDPVQAILDSVNLAVVSSGTATLETALCGVPQVVCYKTSAASHFIAKRLVKVKFISLVNLILKRKLVPELIQKDCNPQSIFNTLKWIESNAEEILKGYQELAHYLLPDNASERAAKEIVDIISSSRLELEDQLL